MQNCLVRSALFVVILTAGAARAASAQTCIAIDEEHDMLDRRAHGRAAPGRETVRTGRTPSRRTRLQGDIHGVPYSPRHDDHRDAIGSHRKAGGYGARSRDLPAVYSQMVRSLTTGQPMGTACSIEPTSARPRISSRAASIRKAPGTPGWDTAASSVSQRTAVRRSASDIALNSTGSDSMSRSSTVNAR